MSEDRDYAYRMETPMEILANELCERGAIVEGAGLPDEEIIAIATRKLIMLYEMVRATGMSEGLLKAAMAG